MKRTVKILTDCAFINAGQLKKKTLPYVFD